MPGKLRSVVLDAQRCDDIVRLVFARPDGYTFKPGQWFRLTLDTSDGPVTKTFSHSSPPHVASLEMATRLSGSAFKQVLAELAPGHEVEIVGPGGRLAMPDANEVVFLTGGVGITPVRSLLMDAAERKVAYGDVVLLYGNREEHCVPYLEDLRALREWGLRLVPVYERPSERWDGERGFITADMVRRHVAQVAERAFVVTGPPAMVSAMDIVLDELEVPSEMRVIERFGA